MKKHILCALLIVCVVCLLTACGDGDDKKDDKKESTSETGDKDGDDGDKDGDDGKGEGDGGDNDGGSNEADLYTIVKNAMDKTNAATSTEAKMTYTLAQDLMGMKSESSAELTMQVNGSEIGITGTIVAEGTEIPCEYYYDGKYLYMSMYGEGYKMAASLEEFEQQAGGTSEFLVDLPKELFDNASGDAGNLVLTLDEATAENLFHDAIAEVVADVVGDDLSQTTTKDAKITLSVKDGYLAKFRLEFTTEIVAGSDKVTYDYDVALEFIKYSGVTVTPMEGYENFYEIDGF